MLLRRGNLFLVGMPGSGKSTLGRVLARSLGKTFVDADQELEQRLGVSISTIFEIEGEDSFRNREEETLARLVQRVDIVLATGGGVILRPPNRQRLRAGGTVLYLHATPEVTWERTRHSKNRPLLQTSDPLARARQLYSHRDSLYRETADLVINVDQQKSANVLAFLREQLSSAPIASPSTDTDSTAMQTRERTDSA
jgi:shikimate kinase